MPKTIAGAPVQDMAEDEEMREATLDKNGHEVLDPVPLAPPVGFQDPPSLEEMIRNFIRSEHVRAKLEEEGVETFDEADDFEVGDDFDPSSPYEEEFDGAFDEPRPVVEAPSGDTGGPPASGSEPPAPPAPPAPDPSPAA